MSKLLIAVTKQEEAVQEVADDRTTEAVSGLIELLTEEIIFDLKDLAKIRDLLLAGKASVLSEVDSVSLHECLKVEKIWIENRAYDGEEGAGSKGEEGGEPVCGRRGVREQGREQAGILLSRQKLRIDQSQQ